MLISFNPNVGSRYAGNHLTPGISIDTEFLRPGLNDARFYSKYDRSLKRPKPHTT